VVKISQVFTGNYLHFLLAQRRKISFMISGSRDLKHVGDTVVKLVLPVGISLNVL
jgi:hypothetical protein